MYFFIENLRVMDEWIDCIHASLTSARNRPLTSLPANTDDLIIFDDYHLRRHPTGAVTASTRDYRETIVNLRGVRAFGSTRASRGPACRVVPVDDTCGFESTGRPANAAIGSVPLFGAIARFWSG